MNIGTYRPGVYSQYTVTSLYGGRRQGTRLGLVGCFGLAEPLTVQTYTPGISAPPPGAAPLLQNLWTLCLKAGVGAVYAVSLPQGPGAGQVEEALGALDDRDVYAVALQAFGVDHAQAAARWAAGQSAQQKERMVFLGQTDQSAAITLAGQLNQERVVLTLGAPGWEGQEGDALYGAAALGLAVALQEDPSVSFSNLELSALEGVGGLSLSQCDALLEAWVSPLVPVGGHVECLRAVTTKTRDGGVPDRSLYPINAILIIDHVLRNLRGTLASLLKGGRQGAGTLSAVGSQVTVLLSGLRQQGIITDYGAPYVYTPGDDPGRCVVEVSFRAAYTINQICITAQVQL